MTQKLTSSFQKWFDAALDETTKFQATFRKARGHVANAGFYFIRAREASPEGEWIFLLNTHSHKIKPRTVQLYIQLAEASLEWTRAKHPELKGAALEAEAGRVIMDSPKPLIALLRDLRELRPFGEYDAIKYAIRNRPGAGRQLELNYDKVYSTFDALDHDFVFEFPEGKSEVEALSELKAKCERIVVKLGAQLEGVKTVEI